MKVELIGWYGGDNAIARAAWTSTQTQLEEKTEDQIRDLIVNKLWNNGTGKAHKTPFERGIVEFNITCDQASHIHLLKHRTSNVNGESARYRELKEDKFYLPEDWSNIKISSEFLTKEYGVDNWYHLLHMKTSEMNSLYHYCLEDVALILGRKRAKESARFFKTMNSEITLSVMMNMSCFHNFQQLRNDSAAQKEIQQIAIEMIERVKNIENNPFKFTFEAFGY